MAGTATCGEAIAGLIEGYGVEAVFGIPGVHTLELYRGLAGSGLAHVLARHEQGAAFMADGYARASGRPAACFLITGPGVTNAATGVAQAYSDSVPMLVVAAVNARADLGLRRGRLHELADQRAVAAPYAGFAATARRPADVPALIARAFAAFAGERPRPVHLEVPIDVLAEPAGRGWRVSPPARPPEAAAADLERAAAWLAAAERPLVVAGGGAAGAPEAVRALAEALGAPVLATVAGKGVLPGGHPLAVDAGLMAEAGRALAAEADVVLVLGSELAETDHWQDRLELSGRMVRVDLDPAKLADDHPADLAIRADAGAVVAALAARLDPQAGAARRGESERRAAEVREAVRGGLGRLERLHAAVLERLRAALPAGAVVASDMTQIAYTGNLVFPVERPRSWLHPVGYGTLGYALPAAIGAKLAGPERPVVALVGDAGLLFTVQELATAAELALPLPVVLWDNDGLGQIRDDMRAAGIQEVGVSPRNPDYPGLARAFGVHAEDLADLDELGAAVAAALERRGPTLIRLPQAVAERAAAPA